MQRGRKDRRKERGKEVGEKQGKEKEDKGMEEKETNKKRKWEKGKLRPGRGRRKENQAEVFFLCLWKVCIKAENFWERILSLTSLILERAYPTNNRKFTIAPQKKSIFIKFVTPSAKP